MTSSTPTRQAAPAAPARPDPPDLGGLAARMRGDVVGPDDPRYDAARAVYNGMIDRRPAAVARCRDVADVRACIATAREQGLTLAVRGGGHNAAGLGVWDDALVADLGAMRSVTVDPAARRVRVDGGCTWADVDHATVDLGLATPSGIVGSTGVGGLTLGGGIGYLARRHGLTVDNLVSADVVLADGSVVRADADHEPDLFWALRGGGGNFGVVTSFVLECHPVGDGGQVFGGPVLYDIADTGEVLRWYRDLLPSLPEELTGWFGTLTVPPAAPFPQELWGRRVCGIVWCHVGPQDRNDAAFEPIRRFGNPLLVGLHTMPYTTLQTAFDALYPPGLQWYWRADFFREISDEAIAVHQEYGDRLPTALSSMHLYPIDGAAARVDEEATAFAHRDGGWAGVVVGVDPDPANAAAISSWATSYQEALHPTSTGAAYVNFLMDEGADRVRASYGRNHDRLARTKAHYDPDNFFHVNQTIAPSTT
jgi:hypothetical protein